jgi:3-oxoacyl-[acyl-carrier-protein] synthase-1
MNRVVITGLGIYSCIGKDLEQVKDSLLRGRSGIIFDPSRKELGFRSALTGFVERPNLKGLLDRRARIMLPEQGEYAYMATIQALAQAGIIPEYIHDHEIGILYGNDSSARSTIDAVDIVR